MKGRVHSDPDAQAPRSGRGPSGCQHPLYPVVTSRSQHCSQPPDASTILRYLLTQVLYIQSKDGVCAYTRMHTRVTACAKPKNRVNASLREGSLHVMP